ncbi:inosine-uridine preferring nucleoside hydrolase [Histoplasma capsulatum H143]|uniref:Inosine-uridine preferring nucleoside hydrolase n=1 Tax=Ajellomyces capsulatus (strain H143) TaxID=544712 RepID=C6HCS0_AJECH|nr:inosine-uridine preferring nucleoside hydrolase [Histoplasma capsulatum H143]
MVLGAMYPRWKWLVLGIDDVLALLLALSSRSEEIEVKLISLTFGNIDVHRVRYSYHGRDGLGDIHFSHPHLTPEQTWESLFFPSTQSGAAPASDTAKAALAHSQHSLFIGSKTPAHQEMLRILKENDPETVTIVAVGPLTNLALAAAEDPETFLRAKEVVVMGGAIDVPGNVTPTAEFNILSKQLTLTLLPLDLTDQHRLTRGQFRSRTTAAPQTATTNATAVVATPSPLAAWLTIILEHSFATLDALYPGHAGDQAALSLHDPLCIWYVLTSAPPLPLPSPSPPSSGGGVGWQPSTGSPEDIRVETTGQWTRGMCVVDRRGRRRRDSDDDGASFSDNGHWLSDSSGNRVVRMASSPGPEGFGGHMLERIFG